MGGIISFLIGYGSGLLLGFIIGIVWSDESE